MRQAQYGLEFSTGHFEFIYTNIVDFEVIGNTQTRLLRIVRAGGEFGENIKHTYTHPLYKKLSYDRLQEIEIIFRTDDGRLV